MFWQFMLTLFASVLQVSSIAWGDSRVTPMPPDHIRLWLDEVRAQREFLISRRKAAQEQTNAHLRAIDPWVAKRVADAAREAQLRREQANQRRKIAEDEHQARMDALERIQQDNIPPPPYYVPYPYPCPNYGFIPSITAPTQCQ